MEVNIVKLNELLATKFNGNKTLMANSLEISREYISKIFNGNNKVDSSKVCNAIILYCEKNNLEYKDYIFLS